MIEVQNLRKRFGAVEAVRGVSFTAADAHITGLLGPNGAGKSTTLRMLYTVLQPDAGDALIDGTSVIAQPLAARARMGVLPHNAGVYPNLSARENIRYFAELHGLTRQEGAARAQELITLLEMGDFADRRAKGFSQGQRIKTALARALVHRPQNLLLDEPTNGLDVMAVRTLRTLLARLREAGHCILFSSHVMQEVAALCDEVVIIAGGAVAASGTPDVLRSRGGGDLEEAFMQLVEAGAAGTAHGRSPGEAAQDPPPGESP
ncbi:MAG TPA: ATP-binding cassette domain-containing protein [Steroidobacteraceae bacterium]|nr:ATP-binding cassette domain-containing protein [Steroidobacteraceae bacterium]